MALARLSQCSRMCAGRVVAIQHCENAAGHLIEKHTLVFEQVATINREWDLLAATSDDEYAPDALGMPPMP